MTTNIQCLGWLALGDLGESVRLAVTVFERKHGKKPTYATVLQTADALVTELRAANLIVITVAEGMLPWDIYFHAGGCIL